MVPAYSSAYAHLSSSLSTISHDAIDHLSSYDRQYFVIGMEALSSKLSTIFQRAMEYLSSYDRHYFERGIESLSLSVCKFSHETLGRLLSCDFKYLMSRTNALACDLGLFCQNAITRLSSYDFTVLVDSEEFAASALFVSSIAMVVILTRHSDKLRDGLGALYSVTVSKANETAQAFAEKFQCLSEWLFPSESARFPDKTTDSPRELSAAPQEFLKQLQELVSKHSEESGLDALVKEQWADELPDALLQNEDFLREARKSYFRASALVDEVELNTSSDTWKDVDSENGDEQFETKTSSDQTQYLWSLLRSLIDYLNRS